MNNCYTCNACNVYDGWCVKCDPKCDKLKFMRKNRGKLPLGTWKISLRYCSRVWKEEKMKIRWPFKFDDIISIFSRWYVGHICFFFFLPDTYASDMRRKPVFLKFHALPCDCKDLESLNR